MHKILILLLFLFTNAFAQEVITNRWVTRTEAAAWSCPTSLNLIKRSDDCTAPCVHVPIAPCSMLVYYSDASKGDYFFYVDRTIKPSNSLFTGSVIPIVSDFGTNGQVLTTNGISASWATPSGGVAPGTIFSFAGTACPSNSLIADGIAVSRTTYSELFTAIGTTWGAGDGSTTFNLPNLTDRFLRGANPGTREVGALQSWLTALPTTAFTTDSQGVHAHATAYNDDLAPRWGTRTGLVSYSNRFALGTGSTKTSAPLTSTDGAHTHSISGGDTETRPANYAVLYCIAVTKSIVPGGGDVIGPTSSVNERAVVFDLTTGKKIKQTNYTLPIADGTNGQVLKANGNGTVSWNTDNNTAQSSFKGVVRATSIGSASCFTGNFSRSGGSMTFTCPTVNGQTGWDVGTFCDWAGNDCSNDQTCSSGSTITVSCANMATGETCRTTATTQDGSAGCTANIAFGTNNGGINVIEWNINGVTP